MSLKAKAAAKGILYGAGYQTGWGANSNFSGPFADECTILVTDYEWQWDQVEPSSQGTFVWTSADLLQTRAVVLGCQIHAHPVIWGSANPTWFTSTVNAGNVVARLNGRIDSLCGRFATKVRSWDVVNEAFEPADGRGDGLRNNVWLQNYGTSYIADAFIRAHTADPTAKLFLSDYGIEYNDATSISKRTAILAWIDIMQAASVPINGFATQMHLNLGLSGNYNAGTWATFLSALQSRGLEIIVSELDVIEENQAGNYQTRDTGVASLITSVMTTTLANTAVKVVMNWSGLSDRFTWMNSAFFNLLRQDRTPIRPLPYDSQMKQKAMYTALANAFDAAPSR